MQSPYTNHYYDKIDAYKSGQYDGFQMTVNRYRFAVNGKYADGVRDGERERARHGTDWHQRETAIARD